MITATYNDITKTTASNAQNECYISADGVRYPQPLVPLTIGGNPSSTGFDDAEWFSGKVYLARLYNGVLSPDEIQNNCYSDMMTAKG